MTSRDIFAVGRGQYENIGDIILRRPLLDWARAAGTLHVYVGNSPDGYDEGLGLRPEDHVYRSFGRWYAALLRSALRGRAHSVYKPGEVQLTLIGMKEHVTMLPAVSLVRLRGGTVSRVGVGARNFAPFPRALMWPSNALSSYTRWRDDRTAAYLGHGPASPDLGFYEGMPDDELVASLGDGRAERDLLVVSLRADAEVAPRPYPDGEWFAGIRGAADALDLRICVVSQVSVDDGRSHRLAADLGGAEVVSWPESRGHGPQEARLREVYRRTAVVASDRLHVLIAGLTEGSGAVGLQLDDSDKISRHFSTIGLEDLTINSTGLTGDELADRIVRIARRRREQVGALLLARERLRATKQGFHDTIAQAPASVSTAAPDASARPRIYHVGRAGDIPGGMTQVINAYLAWPFENVSVRVLESRGDPGDHITAARRLVRTLRNVRAIARRGERAVIVTHLSERGSFLREGLVARYANRLGLPVIAHLHGSEYAQYERSNPASVARVLQACTKVITLSQDSSDISARHVPADRIELVPNAIPSGTPRAKEKLVVFGGVVSHRKGIDVLQEAWREVSDEHPEWELVVAGPVRDEHLVDRALPRTRWLGSVSHARLMELLERAEIAVLPSRDEAMPMFILEAMARRACVISTEVGGIPLVLGGGAGVLLPPGDAAGLGEALRKAVGDATWRAEVAAQGHSRFEEEYSAESVYPRVERIWLDALDDREAPSRQRLALRSA
ncbi:glycosyltransferase [Microbacterium sp. DT81.1]|uniref:glycosyltransferase n=1 Tax=Microbacterium sp. DT81.1 TaxID=3393413 RepID=UPI003CEC1E8B